MNPMALVFTPKELGYLHWAVARLHSIHLRPQDAIKGAAALAALALTFVPIGRKGNRSARWDTPSGSWLLNWRLSRAIRGRKKKTYLGRANGRTVSIDDRARESHMQIVGPTRSGKSQLLLSIAAQDMAKRMPLFLMEAKGDRSDFDQFLQAAKLCSRVPDVRYFNPQDPRSMTFNPIRRVPGQEAGSVSQQIARAIGRPPTQTGDGQDYFTNLAFEKIVDMAAIFCKTGREFTLEDCFYYLASGSSRQKAFSLCRDPELVSMARRNFEANKDVSGLTSLIRPWITGRLGELLNTYSPQIKLEEVFAKGQLAYFAIPVPYMQLLANPMGRMVITGLIDISSWRQANLQNRKPASITLDEFAQFATPSFTSLITTVGSARLWVTLSHQDRQQLKSVEGTNADAFAESIFTNTSGCKVSFRAPSPEDAEYWSSMLGTYKTIEETERVVKQSFGERRTGEVSRKWVEQFKIHPNQMKNLKQGQALVFSPGQQECLAATARIYPLLSGQVPEIPKVEPEPAEGLNLKAAAGAIQVATSNAEEGLIG